MRSVSPFGSVPQVSTTLLEWVLNQHPFFRELKNLLLEIIAREPVNSLDDLVVLSRRPVRTVLIGLEGLVNASLVDVSQTPFRSICPRAVRRQQSRLLSPQKISSAQNRLFQKYCQLTNPREEPALIFGQRRLTPQSAFERALCVSNYNDSNKGRIVFLGDDDMVSPVVAAMNLGSAIDVLDIDREILERAKFVAAGLKGEIRTVQTDLSESRSQHCRDAQIIVCDPFPSGDGSFEAMFWHQAAGMLRLGGVLITTVAPSHKPDAYAMGALHQLESLGFCPVDLRADYGRYEVFDFEFVPAEIDTLRRLGLTATVSHTKSLLTAKLLNKNSMDSTKALPMVDFKKWTTAVSSHYLTAQAGVFEQQEIVRKRGATTNVNSGSGLEQGDGLRLEVLIPSPLRKELAKGENARSIISRMTAIFVKHFDISINSEEADFLTRIASSPDLAVEGPLTKLGLAIRALESWERWSFDD